MQVYHSGKVLILAFLVFFAFVPPSRSQAGFSTSVISNVADQHNGLYLYTYNVTNLLDSVDPLVEFTVYVSATSNLSSITGPLGWEITPYQPGDSLVDFASPTSQTDCAPGSTVSFSFLSPLPPNPSIYVATGFSDITGDFALNEGKVSGPSLSGAIPEPTSMIPLGIGMTTLAGYSIYRGKRQQ